MDAIKVHQMQSIKKVILKFNWIEVNSRIDCMSQSQTWCHKLLDLQRNRKEQMRYDFNFGI